jgi:hypothetical protein
MGAGGNGGSGTVILRIATADVPGDLAVSPGTNSVSTSGDFKICTFTVDGAITY